MSTIPEDTSEFDALMEKVDRRLRERGLPISARPINAVVELAQAFNLPLPLGPIPLGSGLPAAEHWGTSERIYQWYDQQYGAKLKVDVTLGRAVINLDGDLWTAILPLLIGRGMFVAMYPGVSLSPGVYNVIRFVEGMTDVHASKLSQDAMAELHDRFNIAFFALSILHSSRDYELIRHARTDLRAAVMHLADDLPEYGASKWSSLQVAEKVLKAVISLSGRSYEKRGHNLTTLEQELRTVHPNANIAEFIPILQTTAKVRYGEQSCSRDEALAAHYASLQLINELYRAGAPLSTGLSIAR